MGKRKATVGLAEAHAMVRLALMKRTAGMSLIGLARITGIPREEMARFLPWLVVCKLVSRDAATSKWHLLPGIHGIGGKIRDLYSEARPS